MVIFFWVCGWLWKRKGWLRTKDIDVDTDRRELPWDEIHAYRRKLAAMPFAKRIFYKLFV